MLIKTFAQTILPILFKISSVVVQSLCLALENIWLEHPPWNCTWCVDESVGSIQCHGFILYILSQKHNCAASGFGGNSVVDAAWVLTDFVEGGSVNV